MELYFHLSGTVISQLFGNPNYATSDETNDYDFRCICVFFFIFHVGPYLKCKTHCTEVVGAEFLEIGH